jgi:uncharacterized phage protein gp47/JayE
MIDKQILDEVLPLPDLEELAAEKIQELKDEGFVISNFNSGGVFYTILMIVLRLKIEMVELLRTVLNGMFLSHATGPWLDIKLADYGKKRKKPQKTQGLVTLSRSAPAGAITIAKGQVFKTEKDINGEELRFFALAGAVLQGGALSVDVLVEAEKEGSRYNVPAGQITKSLTYISGVDTISNAEGWIAQEGSDVEVDEAARARGLRSWSELSRIAVKDAYINACEDITGVLYVTVNDLHPRGQGTVDVIITSTAGAASEPLLDQCRAACNEIKAPDDNILVMSSEIVTQDITVTVTVPQSNDNSDIEERVTQAIGDLLKLSKSRVLYELTRADLIHQIKSDVPAVRNVIITTPPADVALSNDKVIMPGEITVTVQGVAI